MRLINTGNLINKLCENAVGKCESVEECCELVLKTIEEQPTAYDVDAVVEQLKEHTHGILTVNAIEIVKKGGV